MIYSSIEEPGLQLLARVVALGGDTVSMREGKLLLNGTPAEEPYVTSLAALHGVEPDQRAAMLKWQEALLIQPDSVSLHPDLNDWGPLVLPHERLLVLGDNRQASYDSRFWGPLLILRLSAALLLMMLAAVEAAAAQARALHPDTLRTSYLSTARVDFAVVSDSSFGVGLYAMPSVATVQADSIAAQAIWLDPDSVQAWLGVAPAYLTPKATVGAKLPPLIWTPRLVSRGSEMFWVGRKSAETIAAWEHYVTFSGASAMWRAQVSGKELEQLFLMLFLASTRSRLDTLAASGPDGSAVIAIVSCDDPASLKSAKHLRIEPHLPSSGKPGRAVARYVVGVDGRAEPGSFRVLMATSNAFAEAAAQSVYGASYTPAEYCGSAVRQSVQAQFRFNHPPAPP